MDSPNVKYVKIVHSPTHTAQEAATSAYIPIKGFAKTVIVAINGELAMVVLPAIGKVNLAKLKEVTGASEIARTSVRMNLM